MQINEDNIFEEDFEFGRQYVCDSPPDKTSYMNYEFNVSGKSYNEINNHVEQELGYKGIHCVVLAADIKNDSDIEIGLYGDFVVGIHFLDIIDSQKLRNILLDILEKNEIIGSAPQPEVSSVIIRPKDSAVKHEKV